MAMLQTRKQKSEALRPRSANLLARNLRRLRLLILFPGAFGRLGHETLLERARRDADVAHFAIDDGLDALQVREETPLGGRGHVRADAALFLGLTTAPNVDPYDGACTGQIANSCHEDPVLKLRSAEHSSVRLPCKWENVQ